MQQNEMSNSPGSSITNPVAFVLLVMSRTWLTQFIVQPLPLTWVRFPERSLP